MEASPDVPAKQDSRIYVFKHGDIDQVDNKFIPFKVCKTICLAGAWICMGLFSGITGPTVPDLGERLGTDYDRLGLAIAFKSIGKMTGSMSCGYSRDRFRGSGDLLLGGALSLVAVSVVTKPWANSIAILTALFFLEGFGHGGINAVGNSMCVLMWGKKAAMPVHLLHFGYGVGALLAPLLARPFLSQHAEGNASFTSGNSSLAFAESTDEKNSWDNLTSQRNDTEEGIILQASRIEIPYAIVSGIVLFMGLVYFALFFHVPSRRLTAMLGRSSYSKPCDAPFLADRPCSALLILTLFFFYYMLSTLIDKSLGTFLFTYAVESGIGFTKSEAAYLNTGFFACYAAGRVVIGLLALKLPVKLIIFVEIYAMTLCSAVLTFYAYNKRLLLWIFSCSLAFFFGPIYPSGMSWVDRYVPLYGLVVAIFDVGNGVGAFTANWMSGYLITAVGPQSLLYFNFGAACALCVAIVFAQIIGSKRGDRHLKEQMTDADEEKRESLL